ncbi:MAG: MarR family winged helix-turn-helix transcriptional regulator [Kofleriaceae bacterium]
MTPNDVGHAVKRLQHRHHRAANKALAEHGLSIVQWDVLRHLAREPDASSHRLAELTFQTDQSFGTLATRMVDAGLIERIAGPGRVVRHRITKEGERLRGIAGKTIDKMIKKSFAGITQAELDQLGALLDKVLDTDL